MPLAFRAWRPVWTIPLIGISVLVVAILVISQTLPPLPHIEAVDPALLLSRSAAERQEDASFDYRNPKLQLESHPIEILLWNGGSWAGWGVSSQLDIPNYFTNVKPIPKPRCPVACIFTQDISRAGMADAIMLEPTVPFGIDAWKMDPPALPEKQPHQTWLVYHYESTEYFPLIGQQALRSVMDGEVTYKQHAWLHSSFYCPFASKTLEDIMAPPPPKKDASKLVVFITSNCGSGGAARRLKYVEELMKHIPVDSYGACLHNKEIGTAHHMRQKDGMQHGDVMARRIEIVSEYKFAIAFENTDQEDDYVTEKVWMTWASGTVPIYWGAPNVNEWLPGDDAIIDASRLTPRELAGHLQRIAGDSLAYARYFEWKKHPIRPGFKQMVDDCAAFVDCRICKKLARQRGAKDWPGLPDKPPVSYALKLHGEHDSVEITPAPQLDVTEEYTICAWVYLEAFGYGARIVDKAVEGQISAYSFDILENWGRAVLRLCAGGECHQSRYGLLHQFAWTHVAVTFSMNDKHVVFYIDGEFAGRANINNDCQSVSTSYRWSFAETLASRTPTGLRHRSRVPQGYTSVNMNGAIDSVSLWSAALSQAEIKRLMFTRPRFDAGHLVAFWGFDEEGGDETRDASANQLHGKLKGGAHRVAAGRRPLPHMEGAPALPKTDEDYLWFGVYLGVIATLIVVLVLGLIVMLRMHCHRRALAKAAAERSM